MSVRCYSVAELTQLWAISKSYIYEEIAAGRLPTIQFGRGDRNKLRIRETDAAAWLVARRQS